MAGEQEFAIGAEEAVGSGGTAFGTLVFGYNVDDLAQCQLATGEISLVNGSAEALFVTEVDEGKIGMISDVAGAGTFGRVGVMGIEWRESAGGVVEGVLEDGVGVFYIRYVNESVVRRREDGVSGGSTFVEEGDARAGYAVFIKGVDINVTPTIVSPEEKSLIMIQREVGVTMFERQGSVPLVAAVGFESDGCPRGVSFLTDVGRDVEQRSFRDDRDRAESKIDLFIDGQRELVAFLCGLDDPKLVGRAAWEVGFEVGSERMAPKNTKKIQQGLERVWK